MLIENTTLFKFEKVGTHDGVLTLVAPDGRELESTIVYFDGNSCATLGNVVKSLIKRAEYLK